MSKKRANKSKRRRESQRPQANTSSAAPKAKEPKLHLITGGADAASGIRAVSAANESGESGEASPDSAPSPSEMPAAVAAPGVADDKTPDSEPPASVEDLEEEARFFHEGRIQTPHAFTVADDLDEAEAPKSSPKMTPIARARRAHFSKYVKGAMVAATAILTLAGIRLAIGRSDGGAEHYAPNVGAATALAAPQPEAVAAPAAEKPADKPAEPATAAPIATVGNTSAQIPAPVAEVAATPDPKTDKAEAPKVEATPPAPEPAKVEVAKAEPAKVEEPAKAEPIKPEAAKPEPGGKTAAQEKAEARRLLERGKSAQAIEAGERSVALDPTDGEAWLILGAAYQDKGNLKDARRAFQSCTKEGKRGPLGECRAMLR